MRFPDPKELHSLTHASEKSPTFMCTMWETDGDTASSVVVYGCTS